MGKVFCIYLLIGLLVMWYYYPIRYSIQILRLNTYEELDELLMEVSKYQIKNNILRIIVLISRIPILIIFYIPLCIKIYKLKLKQNED